MAKKKRKSVRNTGYKRPVTSFRINKDKLSSFKSICKKNKISYCNMVEVLIEKFIRGEIMIIEKDFENTFGNDLDN